MRKGKYSLTTVLLIVVILILMITIVTFTIISTKRSQSSVRELMKQRMLNISNSAAVMISGDDLETLTGDISDENTEPYQRILETLQIFFKNTNLTYIYGVKKIGDIYGVVADPDFEGADEFGEEIDMTPALESALNGTAAMDEVETVDRWGTFYSAFSPVYNSAGEVAGVIAVDFDAEWYDSRSDEEDHIIILICIVTLVGCFLLVIIVTHHARRDIADRRKESKELRETKEMIEKANHVKEEFLHKASNEVQTPIREILELDDKIINETHVDKTRFCANNIRTAGDTLLTLVGDILDYSDCEAGKLTIEAAEYDLIAMISGLERTIRKKAKQKRLRLEVNVDETLPRFLLGDEKRISQCLMNLLTNAVKFTEEGDITFSIFRMRIEEKKVVVRFSVEDTGIGILDEDRDRLFQPFERIVDENVRPVEGTGLGLALTDHLLTMMGSRLDVESIYGQGSVFTFAIEQEVAGGETVGDYEEKEKSLQQKNARREGL